MPLFKSNSEIEKENQRLKETNMILLSAVQELNDIIWQQERTSELIQLLRNIVEKLISNEKTTDLVLDLLATHKTNIQYFYQLIEIHESFLLSNRKRVNDLEKLLANIIET